MQPANAGYREAITGATREIIPRIIADFSDPDIVYGAVASSGTFPYTRPGQIYAKESDLDGHYLTLEPHRFILNGQGQLFGTAAPTTHQGYTINPLCNEQAIFTTPQYVQIPFSGVSILQACSVFFSSNALDGIGVDFRLDIYSGAGIVYGQQITGNTEDAVFFTGFTAYEPTALRLTFTRWSLPYRRIRIASVIPGLYEIWSGRELAKVDILQETDLSCLTVPYGVATVSAYNINKRFNPFASGVLQSIEERQSLDLALGIYLPNGSLEWLKQGKYYMQNAGWETNAYEQTWTIRLVDIVGLLSTRPFVMPNPAPTTLQGWTAALVAHLGVNFTDRYQVDASIANTPITGTPADISCGDVLRFICMKAGAFFRADAETGNLRISVLPAGGADGGSLIDLDNQHYYPSNQARKDISALVFELSSGARYTAIGTNISTETGVNIKNPFIHTVADAQAAARNILVHYGGTEFAVKGRGDLAAELGDVERLETGFDTTITARKYKQQFTINQHVMDSAPSWLYLGTGIDLFERHLTLQGIGTYTVPAGVTQLRLILTSGGDGGGYGTNGNMSGATGTPGEGGQGGRVYVVTINVSPGATFNYSVGAGGIGGTNSPRSEPTVGQASVFGNYSSASGTRTDAGYADVYSGGVFGRRGNAGEVGKNNGNPGEDGSGQGGGGGDGGFAGTRGDDDTPQRPGGTGRNGGNGGAGSIVVFYKVG